jgi:CDP-L-myo-inositol myo-inositolphosphotransferase
MLARNSAAMEGVPFPAEAEIGFASARQAGRRIAGVAAAARIIRELAEAGFASAWLVLPGGETLDRRAKADVRRLAGRMEVREGEPPSGLDRARLPGDRLIPAQSIAAYLAGERPASVIDLDGPGAGAEILRRTAKHTDGPVSRWLNRPISRFLSAILLELPGFTPLQASLGTAALALAMFVALVGGGAPGLIVGGLLFQAASIFDGVDGEVARATFRASPAGAKLDTAIDTITTLLFVVGLTVNLASSGNPEAVRFAAWGLVLFVLGLMLIAWRSTGGSLDFHRIKQHYRSRFSGGIVARLIAFATLVTSRDFFALLFAVLTVAGLPMVVLYLFAAAASLWILFVAGSVFAAKATLASEAR